MDNNDGLNYSEAVLLDIMQENIRLAENYQKIDDQLSHQSRVTPNINVDEYYLSSTNGYDSELATTISSSEKFRESTINDDAEIQFKPQLRSVLSSMLSQEDFESGIINPSERYFVSEFKDSPVSAMNELMVLFMNNYQLGRKNSHILVGILHLLSHMDYEEIYPSGQAMAISGLSYSNNEVQEFAIKCFENWDNKDGILKLRAIQFNSKWLQEYANEVIEELERE